MDKITFQNGSTKLNKAMFDTFQNNIDNGKQDKVIAGTWTPTINTRENKAPTITYEKQYGKYRKIGDLVYVDFYIKGKITKLNGTQNYGIVAGLPFNFSTSNFGQAGLSISNLYNLLSSITNPALVGLSDALYIQNGYGGSAGILKLSGDSSYFEIGGHGFYITTE